MGTQPPMGPQPRWPRGLATGPFHPPTGGQRVGMTPLRWFPWFSVLLSTSAPIQRRQEVTLAPVPVTRSCSQSLYTSFAFCALNASRTDGEMLPIFSLLHCSVFPWMRLSQHLPLPVPGWAATAAVTPGTFSSTQSSCWDSSAGEVQLPR